MGAVNRFGWDGAAIWGWTPPGALGICTGGIGAEARRGVWAPPGCGGTDPVSLNHLTGGIGTDRLVVVVMPGFWGWAAAVLLAHLTGGIGADARWLWAGAFVF